MRITMITTEFPPDCGGIGSYVFYLSKELIRIGFNVSVIVNGKENRYYDCENIKVTEIKVPGHPPFNLPIFRKMIVNILSKEKNDIIHIHSTAMPSISCSSPVLVTAHWCNKEGIPIFHRPIRDLDSLYRNIVLPFYIYFEKELIQSCHKLTVVSNSLRNELEKHYKVKADVIYNAVDTDYFNNNGRSEKEDSILFIGKLSIGKGILDLLRIAQILQRSHPYVTIYLIGDGPLKNYINSYVIKKSLSNVKLLGHVSHIEIKDFYKRSRIFVLPTYYEGLPTTILEAMASKMPVVATNISGLPEQIEEGVTGYMLSPGNIKGFYNRIVELLENPEKQKIFGENGREKVLTEFSWPRITEIIIKKYMELLK